ncbi:response regulator [Gymnodinialimonas sp. 2305UL16-5]|uniref:response regulator n=1 Tax=Gymnodinialimonas mytili TaxID=3126503 RepID=UPI0030A4A20D
MIDDQKSAMTHILILEDDPIVAIDLSSLMKSEGYSTSVVASVPDAVTTLNNRQVHLVLTDLFIRDADQKNQDGGNTLVHTIRNAHLFNTVPTEIQQIPIIAITGDSNALKNDHILRPAKTLGANLVLTKPIDRQYLLASIRELLTDNPE